MSVGGGGGGIALKDWTDGRTDGEGEAEDPSGGRESEDVYDNEEEEEEEEEGRASMETAHLEIRHERTAPMSSCQVRPQPFVLASLTAFQVLWSKIYNLEDISLLLLLRKCFRTFLGG